MCPVAVSVSPDLAEKRADDSPTQLQAADTASGVTVPPQTLADENV